MVLGVKWLATLGSICWDFKKLLMEFIIGGDIYKLTGVSPKKVQGLEGEPFVKVLEGAAQVLDTSKEEVVEQYSLCTMDSSVVPQVETLKQKYNSVFEVRV